MSSIDKILTVQDWVKGKEVYSEFAAGSEGVPSSFDAKEWLEERCKQTGEVDFDEKFEDLRSLWGEAVLYVMALDSDVLENSSIGEIKTMLDKIMPRGYQPRHGKVFAEKCHKMLGILYDMGIKTPEEVVKSLDAIRVDYVFSGKSRENATSLSANQKAIAEIVEDFKGCVEQIQKSGLVRDAFYKVDEDVL